MNAPPSPPALQATLRLPLELPSADNDPLLKNTLTPDRPPPVSARPPPVAGKSIPGKPASRHSVAAAQRKLAQHVYYPPEAVALGLEGEVHLLLTLRDDGRVGEVSIAAGSGHPILDSAAVKAAYAMGRVDWARSREVVLPVIFRLE